MTEAAPGPGLARPFSDRVVVLFLTSVVTAGVGIFNGFVLARLLGFRNAILFHSAIKRAVKRARR